MNFYDWFDEIENFSLRSERFFDELEQRPYGNLDQANKRMIAWLRAAYDAGYQHRLYETMDDLK